MKTAVLFLFLFLFNYYCAAQQQKDLMALPLMPSTTDCPKWKKNKNKTNKVFYSQSHPTNNTKVNKQSLLLNNSELPASSNEQKMDFSNKKNSKKQKIENTNKTKTNVFETNNKELVSNNVIVNTNTNNYSVEEKKTISKKKRRIHSEPPVIIPSNYNENKADKIISSDSIIVVKKLELEPNKKNDGYFKRKIIRRMNKKTKISKHSNSKCPSF